jgi:hypothetical protein
MKHLTFACLLFFTISPFFLTSCGGNQEKKTTTSTDSTTNVTTTTDTSKPTIVTSPTNMMVVKHKVSNFAKFQSSYDAHDSLRLANGLHTYVIGRGVGDSNTVLVALKVDDTAKAKAFSKDASLKKAMQQAGVVGPPTIMFTTLVYQDTATLGSNMRSMTTFKVKDWESWRKAFESSRQVRTDNGLMDRVYGYDVDDNHKVGLVVAVMDSAKANAFWKSDLIKQKRAESGVVGVPERFNYRVVKKY